MKLVSIDVAWTKQKNILPAARKLIAPRGCVVTLIKPHYETEKKLLRGGVLPTDKVDEVVDAVKRDILTAGFGMVNLVASPILGGEGNVEMLAELRPL